jgi:hypothetical protein
MTQGCAHHYADYMGRSIEQSRVKKVPLGSKCAIPSCRGTIPYRYKVHFDCDHYTYRVYLTTTEHEAAPWTKHDAASKEELAALELRLLNEAKLLCANNYVEPIWPWSESKICNGKVLQLPGNTSGRDGPCRGPQSKLRPSPDSQYYIEYRCSDNGGTPCNP